MKTIDMVFGQNWIDQYFKEARACVDDHRPLDYLAEYDDPHVIVGGTFAWWETPQGGLRWQRRSRQVSTCQLTR